MNACLISKYPPIEGGESAKSYWMAHGLAERGHQIHVVTNSWEVEQEYRESIDDLECFSTENLFIHNTNPFSKVKFIPQFNPFALKIASRALEVMEKHQIQIIDSWYFLPYVAAAFLVKTITHKPQIVRHAGSDITRIFHHPDLNKLFVEILKKADRIVTYPGNVRFFTDLDISEKKLFIMRKFSVDTRAFNPSVTKYDLKSTFQNFEDGTPIITYFGKIGVSKGIYDLIEALTLIKTDFRLLLVTNLLGDEGLNLECYIYEKGLKDKVLVLGFQPPWLIPSIIKTSTIVVHLERQFEVPSHMPLLPREVMAIGGCNFLSEEIFEKYQVYGLKEDVHAIKVNPLLWPHLAEKLSMVLESPQIAAQIGQNAQKLSQEIENFDEYISTVEELYEEVLSV